MLGKVRITVPKGPAVSGTRVTIDDVEISGIRRASLDLETGGVAVLKLELLPREIVVEGNVSVERSTVCPNCKGRK